MSTNKITTYLLYAVGEIVLVVIGIMIAVGLDNLNEQRKQREVEITYLTNLKNDLQADIAQFDTLISTTGIKEQAAKRIKNRAKTGVTGSLYDFADDMQIMIFVSEFFPNKNTYDEMLGSGNLSIIQNEEIKQKLMELYQVYDQIDFSQRHNRNDYEVFLTAFEQHVNWVFYYDTENWAKTWQFKYDSAYIEGNKEMLLEEANQLYKDKVFLNSMFLSELNHGGFIGWFQQIQTDLQAIIDMIDQELESA